MNSARTGVVRTSSVYEQDGGAFSQCVSLVRAFEVFAGTGVYLEDVAGVHEEGDVGADAGLEFGGLGAALGGVAADPGVGLGDGELDGGGEFDADGLVAVHEEVAGGVFFEVIEGIAEMVPSEGELIVGIGVHEVVEVALSVQVLCGLALDAGAGKACASLDGLIDDMAGAEVTQLHADLGTAAADLEVLDLDHLVERAVDFEGGAFAEVAGLDHGGPFLEIALFAVIPIANIKGKSVRDSGRC